MKHTRIINDRNSNTNIFSYLFGILKVKIYTEHRGENAGYKCFVYITILGKEVLRWFYRDTYSRQFYLIKHKEILAIPAIIDNDEN